MFGLSLTDFWFCDPAGNLLKLINQNSDGENLI